MATASGALPLDVVGIILEGLSDDPSTLRQCSVVSKSFLFPSRKILFSVIQLGTWFGDEGAQPPPCDRLYEVLRKIPRLIACVREIHIFGSDWAYTSDSLPPLLESVADRGLLEVFTFKMYHNPMTWQAFPGPLKAAFVRLFQLPLIHAVQLGDVCFDDFPIEMFAVPPRLKHIGMFYAYRHEDRLPEQPIPESAVLSSYETDTRFLDSLEIGGAAALPLVRFLLSSSSPVSVSKLRSLSLHGTGLDFLNAARKMISVASESIELLSWIDPSLPWFDNHDDDDWDPLDFQALRRVRVVTIQLMLNLEDEMIAMVDACGLPPNIEELIVVVEPSDTVYGSIFDAGTGIAHFLDTGIVHILHKKVYSRLRQIRIVVIRYLLDTEPATVSMFQHLFPTLHATGKLVGQMLTETGEGIMFPDIVKRRIALRGRFED